MAQNKIILDLSLKVDGKDAVGQATLGIKDLHKAVSKAQGALKKGVDLSVISVGVSEFQNSISALNSAIAGLSAAYTAQIEAETKLATNMRNTMGATDDQIESIKALCSAQQELGIVGDEVQLAGAQELATYLSQKSSLEALIPVMNDMIAQQYGYSATAENAANIATMLGKVMDGQTGALSRYGYSFSEAQEQILKFGTETERAAVLAEVITASVGGMNAALAQTDAGRQKQLENTLGDLKETLGGLAQKIQPIVTVGAGAAICATSVMKLVTSAKAAAVAIGTFNIKARVTQGLLIAGGLDSRKAAVAVKLLAGGHTSAAMATRLHAAALRGLLVSTGVGAAIAALAVVIDQLTTSSSRAKGRLDELTDTKARAEREAQRLKDLEDSERSSLEQTRASLAINIAKLKEFNGTKEQEKKLVGEMNSAYGETMGYFNSVSDWYKALTENSEAYCRQMVLEARTRILANQIAQKEEDKRSMQYNPDGSKRYYSTARERESVQTGYGMYGEAIYSPVGAEIAGTSDYDKARQAIAQTDAEIAALNKDLQATVESLGKIKMNVRGGAKPTEGPGQPSPSADIPSATAAKSEPLWYDDPKTMREFEANIRYYKALQADAGRQDWKFYQQRIEGLQEQAEEFKGLGKTIDEVGTDAEESDWFAGIRESTDSIVVSATEAADAQGKLIERAKMMDEITSATRKTGDAFSALGSAIDGSAGSIVSWAGQSLQSIAAVIEQTRLLTGASQTAALAEGLKSGAGLPFPANIGAMATITATILGMIASFPKFAAGGIAYGPTLGLFGEYAGARTNPEVVAPLDRLRALIQPSQPLDGEVRFRIDGDNLVGILNRKARRTSRTL